MFSGLKPLAMSPVCHPALMALTPAQYTQARCQQRGVVCELGAESLFLPHCPPPGQPDSAPLGLADPPGGPLSLVTSGAPAYLSQLWSSSSSSPLTYWGGDRESEAGCSSWSWAGAQACQEKPPCLLAYAANTPRAGARRAGQGDRLWGFGPGSALKG